MNQLHATSETYDVPLSIRKRKTSDKIIAIAGNPNVGKSTVFNGLTGLHQHTCYRCYGE